MTITELILGIRGNIYANCHLKDSSPTLMYLELDCVLLPMVQLEHYNFEDYTKTTFKVSP